MRKFFVINVKVKNRMKKNGNSMDTLVAIQMIGAICGIVIFILILKKRAHLVLNFLVRMVLGAIGIIFFNDFLQNQGIAISVGLNPVSLLTAGTLGFPGVALLYGVVAIKFL